MTVTNRFTLHSRMSDALFLCRNAKRFLESAHEIVIGSDQRLYFIAISIELSLKAYLRHAGWTDDQTRVVVRHNLTKGSALAAELGLEVSMADCVPILGQRYATGGFSRGPSIQWPQFFVRAATSHALNLNDRVARCLD